MTQLPQESLASLILLDMTSIYGVYSVIVMSGANFSSEVGALASAEEHGDLASDWPQQLTKID